MWKAIGSPLRALVRAARVEMENSRLWKMGVGNVAAHVVEWVQVGVLHLLALAIAGHGRGRGSECCERVWQSRK